MKEHEIRCACDECEAAYMRSGRSRYTLSDEQAALAASESGDQVEE